jgi:hypothetical protein
VAASIFPVSRAAASLVTFAKAALSVSGLFDERWIDSGLGLPSAAGEGAGTCQEKQFLIDTKYCCKVNGV